MRKQFWVVLICGNIMLIRMLIILHNTIVTTRSAGVTVRKSN